jgi:uncharacterized protein (DUF1800 family)
MWSKSEVVPFHAGFLIALCTAVLLVGCGGGGGSASSSASGSSANATSIDGASGIDTNLPLPTNDADVHRFLTQATLGPTASDIARVKAIGYSAWIDEQFATPLQTSHLSTVEATNAANHTTKARANDVVYSWWTHAILDPAQLRQRLAFALSEIFVVSTVNGDVGDNGRMAASYLDMLSTKENSTYRDLLEAVALHPAMGTYLSHRNNRKEDTLTGRVPDENFAREVMQLFSIGLYELNADGSIKLSNGVPIETYSTNDVKGLAKVFTGWSWYTPPSKASVTSWKCFWRTTECQDDSQMVMPMSAYASEHSISEKNFLGVTVTAQTTPDPRASLKAALDRLATHPNTAPFISKQLIQRLVTSNPSPTYVADVAGEFVRSNGSIKAVVKAILLHPEARTPSISDPTSYGKLKEPVLRLTQLLRALPHNSSAYDAAKAAGTFAFYPAPPTDDPVQELGQTPLRAPSVFNYFRPGYQPPNTALMIKGYVAPELQITSESSVLGYANFMAFILANGWGPYNSSTLLNDIHFDFGSFLPLVDQPSASSPQKLVTEISKRLLGGPAPQALNDQMVTALGTLPVATALDRRRRVATAILMVLVSPSFITQQ